MKKVDEHLNLPNTSDDGPAACPCRCSAVKTKDAGGDDTASYSSNDVVKHFDVTVAKPEQ